MSFKNPRFSDLMATSIFVGVTFGVLTDIPWHIMVDILWWGLGVLLAIAYSWSWWRLVQYVRAMRWKAIYSRLSAEYENAQSKKEPLRFVDKDVSE